LDDTVSALDEDAVVVTDDSVRRIALLAALAVEVAVSTADRLTDAGAIRAHVVLRADVAVAAWRGVVRMLARPGLAAPVVRANVPIVGTGAVCGAEATFGGLIARVGAL
jgi:hypothetical protein